MQIDLSEESTWKFNLTYRVYYTPFHAPCQAQFLHPFHKSSFHIARHHIPGRQAGLAPLCFCAFYHLFDPIFTVTEYNSNTGILAL